MDHKVATFLYPRYKQLVRFNADAKDEVKKTLALKCWPAIHGSSHVPQTYSSLLQVYTELRRRINEPAPAVDVVEAVPGPSTAPGGAIDELLQAEETADAVAPPPRKRSRLEAALSCNNAFKSHLRLPKEHGVDEVFKYIQMSESEIGDDEDLLQWWKVQVLSAIF